MRKNKLWYLQRINLFKDLPEKALLEFTDNVEIKSFNRGEVIYLPGAPGANIYMVKEGFVRLSQVGPDGSELTIAFLKPGEIFGETEALEGGVRRSLATAHRNALLCVHSKDSLMDLMGQNPDLLLSLTKIINDRTFSLQNQLSNLVFKSVPERLACLLHDLSTNHGLEVKAGTRIDIPLTHHDLARLVGASRQTISTTMVSFKESGCLLTEGKFITITSDALFDLPGP